ncbi:MAG TPA: hypothetical protein PLJ21_13665, partial [Pseudobdellovibrionaceae bacterium]|nr:hypothetical protein [Pseudobdellovibrionaceae bacterium]
MSFSAEYLKHLCQKYPQLNLNNPELLESNLGQNLISPLTIDLPSNVLNQAQDIIKILYKMRTNDTYITQFKNIIQKHGLKNPRNHSILMSYDFHYHEGQLKLIEVNTNAAFLILGYELYNFTKKNLPYSHFKIEDLIANIQNELSLQKKEIKHPKIGIVDTLPSQQKLYLEFLVYKNFFEIHGFPTEILDIKEVNEKSSFDFIYNRSTDFYLEEPDSQPLKIQFLNETLCLSPNPFEYLLLADKSRLTDWSNP